MKDSRQSEPKDRSLLQRLQPFHQQSFGWALSCCKWDQAMAEDVLQEGYLRVVDGRASFAGKSSEKTWFFAVIRQISREQQRRFSRMLRLGHQDANQLLEAANESYGQDALFQERAVAEEAEKLVSGLKSLSSRQREVLHLVFYAELSIEEAAQTLGISLGSARTHYQRGKENLMQLLQSGN